MDLNSDNQREIAHPEILLIKLEQAMENAQAYQIRGMRASQNDEMPISFLKTSVSREVYIKIYFWNDKYIVARQPILEQVKDTSDHHPPNRLENTWHHWTKRIAVKSDLSK